MSPPLKRILCGTAFIGISSVVAVGGYVYAGWGLLDAIYMVVITIFGVGYGEVRPIDDPALIVFTIFVILSGCTAGVYVLGGVVQMVAEGEINRVLVERRRSRGIESMQDHVIICGFGRMGRMLAEKLAASQQAFVVVDNHETPLQEASELGYLVVQGDAAEEKTLRIAGIEKAATLATVLSDDAANVFITLTARDVREDLQIIARGESPATERKLIRSGASRVVLPASIGALKISHLITRPSAEQLLLTTEGQGRWNEELAEIGLEIAEVAINEGMVVVGRTVRDVESTEQGGFIVVAIKRADGQFIKNPTPDRRLEVGDRLLLLGHQEELPQLIGTATAEKPQMTYRGVRA